MIPLDFHTFRDLDPRSYRFVRFSPVPGDVLGDADGEPTPAEGPERDAEASDGDLADSGALQAEIDAKITELNDYLHTLTDHLDSLNTYRYDDYHTPNLPREHPFYSIDDPHILAEGANLLEDAINKLSTSEHSLQQTLDEFHAALGPIRADLDEALLASFSLASTDESPPTPSALAGTAATESVAETGAGGNYTVNPGDTMYDILTTKLTDSTLRTKVAERYQLSTDLAPKDLVLQLFAKTNAESLPNNRLKQDLIYPGDHIFFNSNGLIQYMPQTPESPAPAPSAGDAVAAGGVDSMGDGLAYLDDEPREEGELDLERDRDDRTRNPPLEEDDDAGAGAGAGAEAVPPPPAVEAGPVVPAAAPEEPKSTITESEKLGDLTVNYGEGVHDLLYRYGIAEGKLQFKQSVPNLYSLDPDTFPRGTAVDTGALTDADAVMLAPKHLSYLKIDSTEFKTLTLTKVTDNQLRIEGSSSDGKRSISFLVHLPKLTENRREKAVEAALGEFVEAEINPEDIQVKHESDPDDPNLNRVSIALNKVVIRGRIYGGFKAKASAPDAEQAQKQAIADLHEQVKSLYEKTIKDQHEATLAALRDDFPALKNYLQQHPEIYDLSFEQNSLPGDASGTVGVEMKLSFKIHGIPANFSISKERGPTLAEAIRRSQKALMETLTKYDTGPLEVAHPRTVGPSTAEGAVDTRKIEKNPVSAAEQYAYFRDSITERSDGIYFQFFHPVASLNTGAPCEGLLKPDGTLRLKGPTGLDVSFQVSYTARQNGADVPQEFGQVRLIKTRSGSYGGGAEPRSYKEFMREPLKPWVDKVTDPKGKFERADLVIGDGFLYDVVRDALAKPARQPDGTERPDPETFLGQYRVSNDSPAASRSAALPSGTNYLWIKPIEEKL